MEIPIFFALPKLLRPHFPSFAKSTGHTRKPNNYAQDAMRNPIFANP